MSRNILMVALAALAFAGCAEREQSAAGIPGDAEPYAGTGKQPPYLATGWKPGERAAWEQHVKLRTMLGQNESTKID